MPTDPFTALERDHRQVERLFEELDKSEEGAHRQELVTELEQALSVHMDFEESEVYPLIGKELGPEKVKEAENEHGLARQGLTKLRELISAPGFGAAVQMLKGGIEHHVEEEEKEIFPKMRTALDERTKSSLTSRMFEAKAQAGLPPVDLKRATKDELIEAARSTGVDVSTDMTKDELKAALRR
jgi:hemerythrin superfamily protein